MIKNIRNTQKSGVNFYGGILFLLLIFAVVVPPVTAADPNVVMQKAMKLYEKGDYDKALKHFVKVIRIDPENSEAREYMLRCSQKIVETKLGSQAADAVKREIKIQKKIKEEIIPTVSTYTPVFTSPVELPRAKEKPVKMPELDIRELGLGPPPPRNAKSLLEQRNALTDEFRRRYLGKGKIINIEESGSKLAVTFYMNRLFRPFSDVLKRESYPLLHEVLIKIQEDPNRKVIMKAVDNISPAVRHTMADLPSRRCTVVFSYLLYSSYLPEEEPE